MHNRSTLLVAWLSLGLFVQSMAVAAANEPQDKDARQKAAKQEAEQKSAKVGQDALAQREAARLKATKNIEAVVNRLDLSAVQRAKIKALLSKEQWNAAVSAFSTARETEIHDDAHNLARKTIPGMMQKFMPVYMSSKISAQRRKEKRRGPPSPSEIAKIRQEAQAKMQPAMRKVVMPALDELTHDRLGEMLGDPQVMTRMLADRIIKADILGAAGTKQFEMELKNAKYAAELTTGGDAVLNERTKKMLEGIDLKAVAKSAGL